MCKEKDSLPIYDNPSTANQSFAEASDDRGYGGHGRCSTEPACTKASAVRLSYLSTAVNSREHNNANVLTLGGMLVGRNLARQIVGTWLETDFGGDRHARRVDKIMGIERRFLRK